jgi:transposase
MHKIQELIKVKRPGRNHSSAFKGKVALAAIKGDKTLVELSERFDVHANQITQWKTSFWNALAMLSMALVRKNGQVDVKTLHAKIGELPRENDFLEGAYTKAGLLSARK